MVLGIIAMINIDVVGFLYFWGIAINGVTTASAACVRLIVCLMP